MTEDLAATWAVGVFSAGSRIGGYRLDEEIGRGGMAVVLRAQDERLRRQVALKILAPTLAGDAAFRRRFIRESQAAAAVDHPNIIPIFEADEASGVLFIAMRLVRGGDVRALIGNHSPLPPWRAMWIVAAAASALDAAHAAGLVHRDVKPANMLLDVRPERPDHVYVSDFGLSKSSLGTSGLTGSGQFLGTVDYAAPEQLAGKDVDGRADQYALGCAAFELLCGQPPFRRDQGLAVVYAHRFEPPPLISAMNSGLPAEVDGIFTRVLAKNAGDRFASCQEFAKALRLALRLRPQVHDMESALLASAADEAQLTRPTPGSPAGAEAAALDSPARPAQLAEPVTRTQAPARGPGRARPRRAAPAGEAMEPAPSVGAPEPPGRPVRSATEPAGHVSHPAGPATEPTAGMGEPAQPPVELARPPAELAEPADELAASAGALAAESRAGAPRAGENSGVPGAADALDVAGHLDAAGALETDDVPGITRQVAAADATEAAMDPSADDLPGRRPAAGGGAEEQAGSRPLLRVLTAIRQLRRHPRAILAGGLAAVILAAAATLLLIRSPQHARPTAGGPSPALSVRTWNFSPHRYPDGVVVTRHWTLTGPGGSVLKETLTVSNPTAAPVTFRLEEPVPASIAKNIQTVVFTPHPDGIVARDSAAEWKLHLRAGGSTTITYQTQVPALGLTSARLRDWANAENSLDARLPQPAGPSVRSLTVRPRTIRLSVGHFRQLRLSGRLSSGARATAGMLAGAIWRTGNRSVATVSPAGKVTGRGPGTTRVTVQIGTVRAAAQVTVTGRAKPGAGGAPPYSPPPSAGPAPGPTPTPRPSPTSSPTRPAPSPSPTLTGTPLARTEADPGQAGPNRSVLELIILELRSSIRALTRAVPV